jgi:DNA mismatch repair ATPase MutL
MYGIQDPSSAAASGLDNLYMRENHKCTRYVAEFLVYSTQLNWGDDVLEHIFFHHLPQRLRTEIIRAGRRSGFEALKEQALALDRNYWEVIEESKTNTTQGQQTSNKSNNNNNNNNKNKNKSDSSNKTSSNSGSGNSNSSSSDASKNSGKNGKKDLSNVLVNGRLKPDVRQHRIDNNLCLYCGKKGHKAPECNLRAQNQVNKDNNNNNNTPKARAATTDKKTEASAPASDSTPVSGN